jgi:hypothetical protein
VEEKEKNLKDSNFGFVEKVNSITIKNDAQNFILTPVPN